MADPQAASARRLFALPEPVLNAMLRGRRTADGNVTLDRRMELFMVLSERSGNAFHPGASVDDMRRGYARMNGIFGLRPSPGVSVATLALPIEEAVLSARLYRPPDQVSEPHAPFLVYFHGGGFVIGDAVSYDHLTSFFAWRAKAPVLSIDYRLGPEHPFPTAHDDAFAAYRWAVENAAALGADARRIAVGGDSAGANMAISVCLRARAAGMQQPAFQLLIYPATDSTGRHRSRSAFESGVPLTPATIAWFSRHYARQPEDLAGTLLSPLRAQLRGLPPAHVLCAGFDPLRDEGAAFAEALRAAGTRVTYDLRPTLAHGFVNVAGVVPEARRALEAAADVLAAALHVRSKPTEPAGGAAAS